MFRPGFMAAEKHISVLSSVCHSELHLVDTSSKNNPGTSHLNSLIDCVLAPLDLTDWFQLLQIINSPDTAAIAPIAMAPLICRACCAAGGICSPVPATGNTHQQVHVKVYADVKLLKNFGHLTAMDQQMFITFLGLQPQWKPTQQQSAGTLKFREVQVSNSLHGKGALHIYVSR